jgi:hypothetical protein
MKTIEDHYQSLLTPQARQDLWTLLALARRAETRLRNVQALQGARQARRQALRRACARMTSDDLDAAFLAALRGDLPLALDRISASVSRPPREDAPGSPWRTRAVLAID